MQLVSLSQLLKIIPRQGKFLDALHKASLANVREFQVTFLYDTVKETKISELLF